MARRYFDTQKSQDFTIKEGNAIVYHLRVKPAAISIKEKRAQTGYQVSLEQLLEFAKNNGREVKR